MLKKNKNLVKVCCIALLPILSTGCVTQSAAITENPNDSRTKGVKQSSFTQFSDLPLPSGAKMDLDRTLVLGSMDAWIGRVILSAGENSSQLFDFYKDNMSKFGWEEITTVRSATSILSYVRNERAATIQLQPTTLGGTEVNVTVSPRHNDQNAPAPK